jgi:hypothetical protein
MHAPPRPPRFPASTRSSARRRPPRSPRWSATAGGSRRASSRASAAPRSATPPRRAASWWWCSRRRAPTRASTRRCSRVRRCPPRAPGGRGERGRRAAGGVRRGAAGRSHWGKGSGASAVAWGSRLAGRGLRARLTRPHAAAAPRSRHGAPAVAAQAARPRGARGGDAAAGVPGGGAAQPQVGGEGAARAHVRGAQEVLVASLRMLRPSVLSSAFGPASTHSGSLVARANKPRLARAHAAPLRPSPAPRGMFEYGDPADSDDEPEPLRKPAPAAAKGGKR